MPSLNLALGLRMIRRTARMLHALVLQPLSQIARDVTGSVVAEQSWLVDDVNLVAAGRLQGEVQCIRYILRPHVGTKLPRNDVTAVVVENRAEIEPAPAENLDVRKICLPKLVDPSRLVLELIGCLDDDEGRTCDQIMGL